MAAIWVIFGHSAVIPKKEKWPADIGSRTRDPRFACPNPDHCTTASPVSVIRGYVVTIERKKKVIDFIIGVIQISSIMQSC